MSGAELDALTFFVRLWDADAALMTRPGSVVVSLPRREGEEPAVFTFHGDGTVTGEADGEVSWRLPIDRLLAGLLKRSGLASDHAQ